MPRIPETKRAEQERAAQDIVNWASQTTGGSELLLLARLVAALESIEYELGVIRSKS
jgi:hypothetical protein